MSEKVNRLRERNIRAYRAGSESQRIVRRLLKTRRPERLALALRVSVNTIYRWGRGITPQPGHLAALREYAKRQGKSAKAA